MALQIRKHKRYEAKENAFVVLGQSYDKIGKITNISPGGLSFEYFKLENSDCDNIMKKCEIFSSNNGFHIKNISCRVAWEEDIQSGFLSMLVIDSSFRKCGVEFKDLNDSQQRKISNFIEIYSNKRQQESY